jgi:hypothetical protein
MLTLSFFEEEDFLEETLGDSKEIKRQIRIVLIDP